MLDLKPLFFVLRRLTALFCCAAHSQQNRLLDLKSLFVGVLPTPYPKIENEKFFSRNGTGPLAGKTNITER
jgi:hypothetical protein